MRRLFRTIALLALLASCFLASSCSLLPRTAVYVKPGTAVDIRKEAWVPVWITVDDKKIRGWVRAGQYWRLGPPPIEGIK